MTQLPKSSATNQTGRLGVTILQERVEREGWIFRRQDGDSDFGIDGEIEIVYRNSVTGSLIKCQVKSSDHIEFAGGEESVQVKVATYALWQAIPLLTLLFHVDTSTRAIYWTPALLHYPRPGAASLSIRFQASSDVSADFASLTSYLESWFASRSSEAILGEVATFHRIYEELLKDLGHYDAWTEIGDDEQDSLRLFYAHMLRLRLAVGLSNTALPTLTDWEMRSHGVWGSGHPLFRATFEEAMHVCRPAYDEALSKIEARLADLKLTVENQDLWNFVSRRKQGQQGGTPGRHIAIDSRASDPAFHARIETELGRLGAPIYKFQPKKGRTPR